MIRLQIHIAGAKRNGKTTLAKRLLPLLVKRGLRPVIVDVDEVKFRIFGERVFQVLPDSPESAQLQSWTLEAIFGVILPAIIHARGTPIVAAGHSASRTFENVKLLSETLGTSLKMIILEPLTLEQVIARPAPMVPDDFSDMRDFSNPAIRESFLRSVEKAEATYRGVTDPRVRWIAQASPEEMARQALKFILA